KASPGKIPHVALQKKCAAQTRHGGRRSREVIQPMKIKQVAAQLYTVREFAKTPAEIGQTLKKIRAIGYQAVQLSGLGPISESELVAILKGEGLVCCATHEDGNMILNE